MEKQREFPVIRTPVDQAVKALRGNAVVAAVVFLVLIGWWVPTGSQTALTVALGFGAAALAAAGAVVLIGLTFTREV